MHDKTTICLVMTHITASAGGGLWLEKEEQ